MFLFQQFQSLTTSLTSSWPDLTQYSSTANSYTSFWNTQWKAHGNCSTMEPDEYFSAALKLLKNRDLLAILQSGNIRPGGVNSIQYSDVVNAISNPTLTGGIGKLPRIFCQTKKNTTKSFIVEIRLCLDNSKVIEGNMQDVYIDCPPVTSSSCASSVYLA